jgi:hypothetical protein
MRTQTTQMERRSNNPHHLFPLGKSLTSALSQARQNQRVHKNETAFRFPAVAMPSAFFDERRSVSTPKYGSCFTSNDLLHRLVAKNSATAPNYRPIAQSAEGVPNNEIEPIISMGPNSLECGQVTGTDSDGLSILL